MYITSEAALCEALSERLNRQVEIRTRVNEFVRSAYGIEEMTSVLPAFFSFLEQGEPIAFLARQIVSICTEDVAFEVGARKLGLRPIAGPFARDAFSKDNHDKLHRVSIPWISWSKKGNLVLAHERVCKEKNEELDRVALDRIICHSGEPLPEFHQNLRVRANVTSTTRDVSALHTFILKNTSSRPQFIFREMPSGREEKWILKPDDTILPRDRPPSSWYYPYYLSWFIDGTMVLFETYDNPIGDVSHAKVMFEKAMRIVSAGTGFTPLVVKIPPLSKEMLYCNRHLLERSDGIQIIAREAENVDTQDTVALFKSIAESIIRFR